MSGHTPGPWEWLDGHGSLWPPDGAQGPLEGGLYGPSDTPVVMGLWRNDGYADCEATNEANARLIAAAPDLLNALHALAHPNVRHTPDSYERALRTAREVIARAEGESP